MVVASPPPLVSFVGLPAGWHSFRTNGAVATSWSYQPGADTGGWADHMPAGGIAVTVFFPDTTRTLPALRLLLPRKPATMLEGTRDTPEYRIEGNVNGRDVYVWIDIRRPHPTAVELRAAQRALDAIRFGTQRTWQSHKLTLSYPASWRTTTRPLTTITQPAQRIALYSGRAPQRLSAPGDQQVIAILMEQTNVRPHDLQRQFPVRPARFRIAHVGMVEGFAGDRWKEIVFRDHGRGFYLFVWIGAHAASQMRQLEQALDSLHVG